ncbi:MAG: penicillin-binding protein 3 [Planctomycetota bacterium]
MRSGSLLFGLTGIALVAGAGRLVQLERDEGPRLRGLAEQQHTATMSVPAQRGNILDARGHILAGSKRVPSIFVDASQVDDPRLAAYSIAPVLGLDPLALERLLVERRESGFVWIKRGISDEELNAFIQVRSTRKLNAFVIEYEPERIYPNGRTACHLLGFVGGEQSGLAGVEQAYDDVLVGTDGLRTSIVDRQRRRLSFEEDLYVPPVDGLNVILTIETYLQQRAEYHLKGAVEKFGARWGSAIVLDPWSGEVLAMAVYPDFDPNEPFPSNLTDKQREQAQERIRNRAVSDAYEPGSIFKPFIMGPALESGATTLNEVWPIRGPTHQFGPRTIRDSHPNPPLRSWEVISQSSNIAMGMLGDRLKNDALHRVVRTFGFGDETGIGLPGEHAGLVNDFARWNSYSTQSIPIGQEISATPIQLVTAFAAFCNDGILMRPRIVRGVVDESGRPEYDLSRPIAVRRVMSADAARSFRKDVLAQTVATGTGKGARLLDWQAFGKTGTAQIASADGRGYIDGAYAGSFIGGAPLEHPKVCCLVTIYWPVAGRGYYGGTVAAPTVKAILSDVLKHLNVPGEALLPTSDHGRGD